MNLEPKNDQEYNYQVQGQLLICGHEYCDFMCWSPKGIHIEMIFRDQLLVSSIELKLHQFFVEVILPEIIYDTHMQVNDEEIDTEGTEDTDRQVTKDSDMLVTDLLVNEETDSDGDKIFYLCRRPSFGLRVGCDNQECLFE